MSDGAGVALRPVRAIAVALAAYAAAFSVPRWRLSVWAGDGLVVSVLLLETMVAVIAVASAMLLGRGEWHTVLRLRRAAWLDAVAAGLLGVGLGCGYSALDMRSLLDTAGAPQSRWATLALGFSLRDAVLLSILPALGEEMLCRGLLVWALERVASRHGAVWLSAILFAALHTGQRGASGLASVLALGVLAGYLTVLSGSLLPAVVCHACSNGAVFSATALFGRALDNDYLTALLAATGVACAIAAVAGGMCLAAARFVGNHAREPTADTHTE